MKIVENFIKEVNPYWKMVKFIMFFVFIIIVLMICTSLMNEPNTLLVILGVVGMGLLFVFVIKTTWTFTIKRMEKKDEKN